MPEGFDIAFLEANAYDLFVIGIKHRENMAKEIVKDENDFCFFISQRYY